MYRCVHSHATSDSLSPVTDVDVAAWRAVLLTPSRGLCAEDRARVVELLQPIIDTHRADMDLGR